MKVKEENVIRNEHKGSLFVMFYLLSWVVSILFHISKIFHSKEMNEIKGPGERGLPEGFSQITQGVAVGPVSTVFPRGGLEVKLGQHLATFLPTLPSFLAPEIMSLLILNICLLQFTFHEWLEGNVSS